LLLGQVWEVGVEELLLLSGGIGEVHTPQGELVAPPLQGGREEAPLPIRGCDRSLEGDGATSWALPDQHAHPC
jgi:hypothetical protein